jgi:hypothetical protein
MPESRNTTLCVGCCCRNQRGVEATHRSRPHVARTCRSQAEQIAAERCTFLDGRADNRCVPRSPNSEYEY